MVIDSNSLLPLHDLTTEGKINYQEYLDNYADELIYKHNNPLKYFIEIMKEKLSGN